ncbi:Crp/Fnr family transcriptional regulator [Cupriavidus necator]|uniref:Crp/Fnr family transcriptional regulator n=1 Tax=Cupriavidus necator TaxID=106590 RepID=UPI003ECF6680
MDEIFGRLAITQSELFNGWPDEAISRLVQNADVLVVEAGNCLHRSGDTAKYLCLVVSGSMILSLDMPWGGRFTAGLQLAGDFHGLGPAIAQRPHTTTAVCKERTVLVRIPADLLRELVSDNGGLSFSLFAALERRHLQALNLHASAAVNSTQARIAGLLKSIIARGVRGRSNVEINLSQEEIAAMLGTRRQVVSRVLRDMAAAGVIHIQYGRISIVDREKLNHMAPETQ